MESVAIYVLRMRPNADGRYVNTTYVTHDGGNSWQAIDVFEKNDPYPGQ